MSSQLAIIIPAYRSRFFRRALQSIATQSCKDFTLYIGDDASPDDLYSIVQPYENILNIIYKRFSYNLGQSSLTKQWERCIALSREEDYLWLFADDDEMSTDAVSSFYDALRASGEYDLYRFDMSVINPLGDKLVTCTYPPIQSALEFFESRIQRRSYSCITQFIFSREAYLASGGFVDFPLGWCSDDATLLLLSKQGGIKAIEHGSVNWRLAEGVGFTGTRRYNRRHAKTEFAYAIWFNRHFENEISIDELSAYTRIYLEKRVAKLNLRHLLQPFCVKAALELIGMRNLMWLLGRDILFRLRRLVVSN